MEVENLKLEAIEFTAPPTKSQIVYVLRDIAQFLNRMGASLILDGSYTAGDAPLGETLNSAIKLKQCAQSFEDVPSTSGLTVPQPHVGNGPRRV